MRTWLNITLKFSHDSIYLWHSTYVEDYFPPEKTFLNSPLEAKSYLPFHCYFEDLFNFHFEASATSSADKSGKASSILQEHVARLESSDVEAEDSYPDTSIIANAFSQLFDSPCFTRLWVVQEVGMAKPVLTFVGDATIDFVDLIRFVLRLERRTLLMD